MSPRRRTMLWVLAAAAIVAAVALYALFDPAVNPFPRCPFLTLTGFKCPGCGSQRAIHALIHLRPADAWNYNPMLVASAPVVALMLVVQIGRSRMPRLYNFLNSRPVILTALVMLTGWWVARNILDL